VIEAVLFAAFVSPPMPVGRAVAMVKEPEAGSAEDQVTPKVVVETAPGARVNPAFDWYVKLPPLELTRVQSVDPRASGRSAALPVSRVNTKVKVIWPTVGPVPTLAIVSV